MAKSNDVVINGTFKGLATTRGPVSNEYLSDMSNMHISSDSSYVERRSGTRVIDSETSESYYNLWNITVSNVEILIGINYKDRSIYGYLRTRPEKKFQLRDISCVPRFKNGTLSTNILQFSSGTKFKLVENQHLIYIWASGKSEIIVIQKKGIVKIAKSLEYNELTNFDDMVETDDSSIYVNSFIMDNQEQPLKYFAEDESINPVYNRGTYLAEFSDSGTVGINSEISQQDISIKTGGYYSPFELVNAQTIMKGSFTNDEVNGDYKYIYPDRSGGGTRVEDTWDATLNAKNATMTGQLFFLSAENEDSPTIAQVFSGRTNQWFFVMLDKISTSPDGGETEINNTVILEPDKYPIKFTDTLNGMESWIRLEETPFTIEWQDYDTPFAYYKFKFYLISDHNINKNHNIDVFQQMIPISVFLDLVKPWTASWGDSIGGRSINGTIDVYNDTTDNYCAPSALLLKDNKVFDGTRLVGIQSERFTDYIEEFDVGLNTDSIMSISTLDIAQNRLDTDIDSDVFIDNYDGEVTAFMNGGGFRFALFDTVDNTRLLSRRGFNIKIDDEIEYCTALVPYGYRTYPKNYIPNDSELSLYYSPIISTKYAQLTTTIITGGEDHTMPLDISSAIDIEVVGPYIYAVSDNYILRGSSQTLTINNSIEVSGTPKQILRLSDALVVIYRNKVTVVKSDGDNIIEDTVVNGENLNISRAYSSGDNVILISDNGEVYSVGYKYSDIGGNVRTKFLMVNKISGEMEVGTFTGVVDMTSIGGIIYIATDTYVYMYNTLQSKWSGIYEITQGDIRLLSKLNEELVIHSLYNVYIPDMFPSDDSKIVISGGLI